MIIRQFIRHIDQYVNFFAHDISSKFKCGFSRILIFHTQSDRNDYVSVERLTLASSNDDK